MSYRRHSLSALAVLLTASSAFAASESPDSKLARAGEETKAEAPEAIFKRLRDHIANAPLAFDTKFVARSRALGTLHGSSQFLIGRPNLLRVALTDGHKSYQLFSDGNAVTIFDTKTRKFAEMPGRSTPAQGYGVLPGLMSVETEILNFIGVLEQVSSRDRSITIAAAGSGKVGGHQCDRFKITERLGTSTKNWEVWLAKGEPRLPCKFLTSSADAIGQFSQTNEFTWKPAPRLAASEFIFTPPAGAEKVSASGLGLGPPVKAWR
jgi:hypothetical protein